MKLQRRLFGIMQTFSLQSSFPGSSRIDSFTIYHFFFTVFIPWIKQYCRLWFLHNIPCFLYILHSLDQAELQIMIPPRYIMFSLQSSFPGSSWIADYDSSTIYHVFFTFFIPWIKLNCRLWFLHDISCFLYSLHSLDQAELILRRFTNTMFSLQSSFPGSSRIDSSTIYQYHVFFTVFIPWIKQNWFFYDIPCFLYSLHTLDQAGLILLRYTIFSLQSSFPRSSSIADYDSSTIYHVFFTLFIPWIKQIVIPLQYTMFSLQSSFPRSSSILQIMIPPQYTMFKLRSAFIST